MAFRVSQLHDTVRRVGWVSRVAANPPIGPQHRLHAEAHLRQPDMPCPAVSLSRVFDRATVDLWTCGAACRPRPVRPALTVLQARYENGRRVRLRFNTGEQGVADLTDLGARYPAAGPLADPAELANFDLDEWPTLVWACGFYVSPESRYERATGKRRDWLMPAPVVAD